MHDASEMPRWMIGALVAIGLVLLTGIYYRFLGPGSEPPRPTQVAAPEPDGISPKARVMYERYGRQ
jgi:hypothetical protein